MRIIPIGRSFALAAAVLAVLLVTQPAEAGTRHTTRDGRIPSGPTKGQDEPGPGARIANKAFGYYIGRVMPEGQLNRTAERVSHSYGRITGPDAAMNMCGWLHNSARGRSLGNQANSCSKRTATTMWQRRNIGQDFSAPAGTKGHSGVPVPVNNPSCAIHYNYFRGTVFTRGALRDAGGPLGAGTVSYRYRTLDGKAAVILHQTLGWGFVDTACVDLTGAPKNNDRDPGRAPNLR